MVFDSSTITGIKVNNRIFRSATHDGLADDNGAPTRELISRYENIARNNAGCIITGYAAVSKNGVSPYPSMLKIYDDDVLEQYRLLTQSVHKHNTPIVLQIAHCGRQTASKKIGAQKVAPSNVFHSFYPDSAKVMTRAEIYGMVDDFVAAAVRAERAGFDAVQLHGGHGYILHDFISPYGNRRYDEFGGSLENRCRAVELIIKGIKAKTKLPVWIKISASDNRKGGMNVQYAIRVLQRLQAAGLDAVEVSCGTVQDGMNTMRSRVLPMDAVFRYREPCASFPQWLKNIVLPLANMVNPMIKQPSPLENFNADNSRLIKQALDIPVIVVGGIHRLADMENILQQDKADYVSMCRPFICEPNLVRKLMDGTQTEAKCIMCNYCGLVIEKESTKCLYGKLK